MPMSPLPKLAGGRPLPDAAIAPAGVRAAIKAPLPITAPPARPAFFRKLRRVSPDSSDSIALWWVSAMSPLTSIWSSVTSGSISLLWESDVDQPDALPGGLTDHSTDSSAFEHEPLGAQLLQAQPHPTLRRAGRDFESVGDLREGQVAVEGEDEDFRLTVGEVAEGVEHLRPLGGHDRRREGRVLVDFLERIVAPRPLL